MLVLTEQLGDVKFFTDDDGKQYQQIGSGEVKKVANGKIVYTKIKQVNGYTIKYNTNGVYGFVIFKGNNPLQDRIWKLAEAEAIARHM